MVGAKLHGNCKIEYFSSVATVFFLGIIKRENPLDIPVFFQLVNYTKGVSAHLAFLRQRNGGYDDCNGDNDVTAL